MKVEAGTEYSEPGVEAEVTGSILRFVRIRIPCTASTENLNTNKLGNYTITYTANFAWMHATGTRIVTVQDTTPPVIELQYKDDYYTLPNHAYEEEGYTATDNYDGDITDKVTSEEKDGRVYYSVADSSGNTDTAEREIVYDDRTAPDITFPSGSDIYISEGDTWTDDVTAQDDADGDVTDKIEISGEPDTSKPGTYTVTYKVTDSWGNEATATRTITVEKQAQNDVAQIDETKIIYLTFDDGPGKYTEKLLGILDKYNVKATFFVTAAYSDYQDLIGREYEAGHSVGVHSASHDYAKIYKSTDAYWEDFEKMEDIIEKQTGSRTRLFRFPGGSSNTVSASYSKGIMTELTKEAGEKGLTYVDWNVSSGDAGDTTDGNVMYNNMIKGIHTYEHSFILCHDVKEYTVNMIENFIKEALKEGYTFLPITNDSPTCHHKINN